MKIEAKSSFLQRFRIFNPIWTDAIEICESKQGLWMASWSQFGKVRINLFQVKELIFSNMAEMFAMILILIFWFRTLLATLSLTNLKGG